MKRAKYGNETDSNGRTIFYVGGDRGVCRACGAGPAKKLGDNGTHVLYHVPADCQRHDWKHAQRQQDDMQHVYRGGA